MVTLITFLCALAGCADHRHHSRNWQRRATAALVGRCIACHRPDVAVGHRNVDTLTGPSEDRVALNCGFCWLRDNAGQKFDLLDGIRQGLGNLDIDGSTDPARSLLRVSGKIP